MAVQEIVLEVERERGAVVAKAVREIVLDIDFVGGAEGSGVAMADFEMHCEVDLV